MQAFISRAAQYGHCQEALPQAQHCQSLCFRGEEDPCKPPDSMSGAKLSLTAWPDHTCCSDSWRMTLRQGSSGLCPTIPASLIERAETHVSSSCIGLQPAGWADPQPGTRMAVPLYFPRLTILSVRWLLAGYNGKYTAIGKSPQTGGRCNNWGARILLPVNSELTSACTATHSKIAPSILNELWIGLAKLECRSCACQRKVR